MKSHRFQSIKILAILAGFTASCGRQAASDIPQAAPAYVLTTEGAEEDIHAVLLQILQNRMKPVRIVGGDEDPIQLGTIHVVFRVYQSSFETSDRKEKAKVPTNLSAKVTVHTYDGSSNWDGEHSIGFEVDAPHSFSDSAATRRRYAKRLLEVAVKQLPGRGVFKHDSLSPASPAK